MFRAYFRLLQHTIIVGQVDPKFGCQGRQSGDEVLGLEQFVSGAVSERALQLKHHQPVTITSAEPPAEAPRHDYNRGLSTVQHDRQPTKRIASACGNQGDSVRSSRIATSCLSVPNTLSLLFDGASFRDIIFTVEQAFSAILNLQAFQKIAQELVLAVTVMLVAGSAKKSRKLMLTNVQVSQG